MRILGMTLLLGIVIFAILIGILVWQRYQFRPILEQELLRKVEPIIYPNYNGKG